MLRFGRTSLPVFAAIMVTACMAHAASSGPLRVGAAKVDITPSQAGMPKNYLGVLDPVYARSIVIDNGHTSAVLISLDAGAVLNPTWQHVSERIEKELGIPVGNVLITATHSHSVPSPYRGMGAERDGDTRGG